MRSHKRQLSWISQTYRLKLQESHTWAKLQAHTAFVLHVFLIITGSLLSIATCIHFANIPVYLWVAAIVNSQRSVQAGHQKYHKWAPWTNAQPGVKAFFYVKMYDKTQTEQSCKTALILLVYLSVWHFIWYNCFDRLELQISSILDDCFKTKIKIQCFSHTMLVSFHSFKHPYHMILFCCL